MSAEGRFKTTGRALNTAVQLYTHWWNVRHSLPLDRAVEAQFREQRTLNSGERRWIAELVYGSVRYWRRTGFLLKRLGLPDTPELRIHVQAAETGGALPHFLQVGPESLASARLHLPQRNMPADYLRITLSFPDDLAAELEAQLGPEAIAAAEALNTQAPTTLRVNTLRATRAKVLAVLPDAEPTRFAPQGVILSGRVHLPSLSGFREGWFEAQEEASQLAAWWTEAQPGQTVVEVGAGGGGKTLALAAQMQNRGRILAIDSAPSRLEELKKRVRRAGVNCVETVRVVAGTEGLWEPHRDWERWIGRADVALLDAPCTGSGILRRNPDTKWRMVDCEAFSQLQANLLRQSAAFVAPGGTLLYVTCALERWQNEAVVEAFLNSTLGANFTLEPLAPDFPNRTPGLFLRTWPHLHNLDAFFLARLRRT